MKCSFYFSLSIYSLNILGKSSQSLPSLLPFPFFLLPSLSPPLHFRPPYSPLLPLINIKGTGVGLHLIMCRIKGYTFVTCHIKRYLKGSANVFKELQLWTMYQRNEPNNPFLASHLSKNSDNFFWEKQKTNYFWNRQACFSFLDRLTNSFWLKEYCDIGSDDAYFGIQCC